MVSARRFLSALSFALVLAFTGPIRAEVVTLKGESPAVSVDVPEGFEASESTRGLQAKTPDGGVYVWFETYQPDEVDTLIKEHEDYWTKNEVELGDQKDRDTKEFSGKKVIATDFKAATWKGKPTVVRYLFIDANLPSKKLILMSLWASPEADQAHDKDVMNMISSIKISE